MGREGGGREVKRFERHIVYVRESKPNTMSCCGISVNRLDRVIFRSQRSRSSHLCGEQCALED
jgi:hypothetical protein